jgi:hypothetical protein
MSGGGGGGKHPLQRAPAVLAPQHEVAAAAAVAGPTAGSQPHAAARLSFKLQTLRAYNLHLSLDEWQPWPGPSCF